MDPFKEIRPYNDSEVRPVLESLLANSEFIEAITALRFPRAARSFSWLLNPLVKWVVRRQLAGINTVLDFQQVVKKYMTGMIDTTTEDFTVSGLAGLKPDQAYLFMSNHRDIALDPAFVNYALFNNGMDTMRIAIGDNLLTKDYVSDLMRLNKSFIVNRSAKGRQMLAAYKQLSTYMHHSIVEDESFVWIAQREGRAKDGADRTEPAIIKMLSMAQDRKNESFADYIRKLHIVPVSISYEFDPCDAMKANELCRKEKDGIYQKGEQEDIQSIAAGIAGQKGRVHVAFGKCLDAEFKDADEVATEIDRQVLGDYSLHSTNYLAYKKLHGAFPEPNSESGIDPVTESQFAAQAVALDARLAAQPKELRDYMLRMYAYPILSKQRLLENA